MEYLDYILSMLKHDIELIPQIAISYKYGMGIIISFFWIVWSLIKVVLLLVPFIVIIDTIFNNIKKVISIKIKIEK